MTPFRLYDSWRRSKVAFEPLVPDHVGVYVCGPTTYAPAHIGHAYSAIAFDTVRRCLEFLGWQVKYVRNVTDIDDKIINRANELHEDPFALSARFAAEYNRDMARFGVRAPSVEPKVTEHISQIISVIEKLVANGLAYDVNGDVYYEVAKFATYGKLSGQTLDELQEGARISVDERKRAAADFALWKSAKPGEPSWDSPWGKGRPGWHIECSAMTVTHLGETFDIHAGGKDLIFPHHENEIAQSQGADGAGTFAHYWMHNGFLNFEGVKMSKSLGNVFNCEQIAEAVGGEALRFFCVSHHYRSPVDFEVETLCTACKVVMPPELGASKSGVTNFITSHAQSCGGGESTVGVRFRSLEAADRGLAKFYETLQRIDAFFAQGGDAGEGPVLPEAAQLVPDARAALADDFNAPVTMAALHAAAQLANRLLDEGKGIDKQVRRRTLARLGRDLRGVGAALGIFEGSPAAYLAERRARLVKEKAIDVALVITKISERTAARAAKDWKRGDEIRAELVALGVALHDGAGGTDWSVQD
ncbi:cysteine--tRNA ligase [soil metagenome]